MRFDARMTVDFEVRRRTNQVVLNSARIDILSVQLATGNRPLVKRDEPRQRSILEFDSAFEPGRYRMSLRYAGTIGNDPRGFFVANDDRFERESAPLYAGFCCVAAARNLAPLWDQLDMKAIFALQLILTEPLDVVANMPVKSRQAGNDGTVRVAFEPTPMMSPHNLFFAIGQFDRSVDRSGDVEVGVVVPRGSGHRTAVALATSRQAMSHLNEMLAPDYPLPKIDAVGLPIASVGATAYWGAPLFSERFLTVGEAWSSMAELQASFRVIAHELGHQWFFDLVTMQRWNDIWLSEAFGEWLSNEVTQHFHPEWQVWPQQVEQRERMMQIDAAADSAAVMPADADLDNPGPLFEVAYFKGSQILRMLEAHAGVENFRRALREYLRRHAYGTANSAQFWQTMSEQLSSQFTTIGRSFIEQPGVPLIEVLSTRCVDGRTVITLRQDQFHVDAATKGATTWHVPVTAFTQGAGPASAIVHGPKPAALTVPGCGVAKVNAGGVGYYRTRYDNASLDALASGFLELPGVDQLNLLADQYALAETGYQDFGRYLDLAARLTAAADPVVYLQWVRGAVELDNELSASADRPAFRAFASTQLRQMLAKVGWERRPGEPDNIRLLRPALIGALGHLADAEVRAECLRRLEAVQGQSQRLPPDLREAIVRVSGTSGTADESKRQARMRGDGQAQIGAWLKSLRPSN